MQEAFRRLGEDRQGSPTRPLQSVGPPRHPSARPTRRADSLGEGGPALA